MAYQYHHSSRERRILKCNFYVIPRFALVYLLQLDDRIIALKAGGEGSHDSRYVVHEAVIISFCRLSGCRKVYTARNFGRAVSPPSVDTDRLAERIAGKSLAEIYEDDGGRAF